MKLSQAIKELNISPIKGVIHAAGVAKYNTLNKTPTEDVAAVLASLYPASTILLAAWRLHERPTRRQWLGMGLALVAVVMISI